MDNRVAALGGAVSTAVIGAIAYYISKEDDQQEKLASNRHSISEKYQDRISQLEKENSKLRSQLDELRRKLEADEVKKLSKLDKDKAANEEVKILKDTVAQLDAKLKEVMEENVHLLEVLDETRKIADEEAERYEEEKEYWKNELKKSQKET